MQVKNITPIERHVEKILLLVGILFAGWLIYRNFAGNPESVPLPGQTRVLPGQVGPRISQSVGKLENLIHNQANHRFTPARLPDYVGRLVREQTAPLPAPLALLPPVSIGPWNTPVISSRKVHLHKLIFVVPKVPALVGLKVKQNRGVAVISLNKTRDLVWVKVSARFPMARWRADLKGGAHLPAGRSGLPPPYRRTTFFRLRARREKLLADGRWGRWKSIKGFYVEPPPMIDLANQSAPAIPQALGVLDRQVGRILTPAFYPIESIHLRIIRPQTKPHHPVRPGGLRRGRVPGGTGPGSVFHARQAPGSVYHSRGAAPLAPSNRTPSPLSIYTSHGGSTRPPVISTPARVTMASLLSKRSIKVFLYDTSAKPGSSYRYELRVLLYNPTFRFPYRLNHPAARRRPWLASPWSLASPVVGVRNSMYFFLAGGNATHGRVEFQIFKWVHGMWTWGDETVSAGQPIGTVESASLIDPKTGRLVYKLVNFNTGYTLVDARRNSSGASVTAVVRGPHGRLLLRNSAWDNANPQWAKLIKAVNQAGSPAVSAGGAGPSPAVP